MTTATSLTDAFVAYLVDRENESALTRLADALARGPLAAEAGLLGRLQHSGTGWTEAPEAFGDRRIYLGEQLPPDAADGDLWFDPCEVVVMTLLSREIDVDEHQLSDAMRRRLTPFIGWLSIRPVARWQFGAFLRLADLRPRRQQLDSPLVFLDRSRLLGQPELAPVTAVTITEASLFCTWMGKRCAGQDMWQRANAILPPTEFATLWGDSPREWADFSTQDSTCGVVISPSTIDRDPDDEFFDLDSQVAAPRMVYGEWARMPDVTFRTEVRSASGLFHELSDGPVVTMEPFRLEAPLLRSSTH